MSKRVWRCTECDNEECTYVDRSGTDETPNHCIFSDGTQQHWVEVTNVKKYIRELEKLGYVVVKKGDFR